MLCLQQIYLGPAYTAVHWPAPALAFKNAEKSVHVHLFLEADLSISRDINLRAAGPFT